MKRNLSLFIEDILDAITKIQKSIKDLSKKGFIEDVDIVDATVRRIEIIGEAVKNLPLSFKDKHSSIPWRKMAGMRDIIIHGYFRVDLNAVWNVIKKDLPDLKRKILRINKSEKIN